MKKPASFPLRYRFMLTSSLMLILLLGTLALMLGSLQTRTIQDRIEKQGLDIAQNLAAVSRDHFITYNYVALEKLANQVVDISDILYVVFYDKEAGLPDTAVGRISRTGYSPMRSAGKRLLRRNRWW